MFSVVYMSLIRLSSVKFAIFSQNTVIMFSIGVFVLRTFFSIAKNVNNFGE